MGERILLGVGSPNVRKVGILLEELELDYELRSVAVSSGEQFTAEFLAMNPFAKVPVYCDPDLGAPLFESGAILIYLAERHGRFLSSDPVVRYQTIGWVMAQMANVGPMLGQLNHFRILPPGSEPYAEARYAAQAERIYRVLDDRLASHEWIAGDAYSIADIAIYPWTAYLEKHGFSADDHAALVRWRDLIDARPAVQRSWARFAEMEKAGAGSAPRPTPETIDRFFGRTEKVPPADYSGVGKASPYPAYAERMARAKGEG